MIFDKSPDKIKKMFNMLADEYDRNNNFISCGLHKIVKYVAVKSLDISENSVVYDLCCGTGDIAGLLYKKHKNINLTGFDFSENMLRAAKKKYPQISFLQSDITDLPVENSSADIITIAFGLRNVQNRDCAVKEIYRVLKQKGKIMHLDFGRHNIFSKIFDITVKTFLNFIPKYKNFYEYLLNSKSDFPTPEELIKEFESFNFKLLKRHDLLFGIISVQIFEK